ncbi:MULTISPECIES: YceI family protein [Streptomyces]|uniref:YceI family protein n=1 Tax=Streptomyces koelreuteriae TaxID=2838015 RepID=A0ABX8FJ09_9ACTN|nr:MULTISPECIES: YceI family protein [Streptomyces]QWB21111.1 YceI family protein [Streptomyces koelreuteriae]UUA04019.1 YceI family protein [Streptomyces koelreuteriae]UUA11644.1 YceI family protein [Streptomyces sp. CRCS-T-1]
MNLFNRVVSSRRQAPPVPPQRPAGAPASPTAVLPDPQLTNLTGEWVVDPAHSRIGFSVRHAMVTTVRGCFLEYESRLYFDARDPARSRADITLFTSSVDTGVEQRDAHLVGRDFLDAATYPRMRFTSTGVEQTGSDLFRMSGELTIKGVSRPVVLDLTYIGHVTDPFGYERAGFDGTTTINRSDWGLTYNSRLAEGGAMVSEKVRLQLDIAAIRMAPSAG